VEKNFHPTVSHIRKALNSNQAFKQNFVMYRDGDYMLNPDLTYRIDIVDFDRLVAEGEAARRAGDSSRQMLAFEQALELVRGEFMQGSYEDWVEPQRSHYDEQALRLMEALAQHAAEQSDWSRALDLAQGILRADSFREDIHRMAMRAYAWLGNRMAVKEQYEQLRKALRKELDVEPEPETTKLFQELIQ
jgi:DNA-binding SARP family transcriptional activator